jgi:hypothetical protein
MFTRWSVDDAFPLRTNIVSDFGGFSLRATRSTVSDWWWERLS